MYSMIQVASRMASAGDERAVRRGLVVGGQARHRDAAPLPGRRHLPRAHLRAARRRRRRGGADALRPARQPVLGRQPLLRRHSWHDAPHRRSAPTMSGPCCGRPRCIDGAGRRSRRGRDRRRRARRRRGRRDQGRGQAAGGRRAAVGDRRGVPPRAVARRLPVRDPRDRARARSARRCPSTRRDGHDHLDAERHRDHRAGPPGRDRSSATTSRSSKQTGHHARSRRSPSPRRSMAHFRVDLSKSPYTDRGGVPRGHRRRLRGRGRGLYELGCRYLQFDDTIFAFLNDPAWRANATRDRPRPRPPARDQRRRDQRRRCAASPPTWRSPCTCAAATTARRGSPPAATTSSPRTSSAG